MNYKESLKYLDSLTPNEFHLKLEPIIEASNLFDDPPSAYPSIHIAGTNGKGSTATFLTSIIMKSGYRIGLYTSPHLVDVNERIQINRTPIPQEDFARLTELIREKLPEEKFLSYFELLTLMAFIYFKENKIDLAVIETGLGGRLDATNIVAPQLVIITPISFDHKQHLGNTLAEIANEKCGVIKQGIPTITAEQPPEVMAVIQKWCDELGSPLCIAHPDEIETPLGLLGKHQLQNAACAVDAAHLLSNSNAKFKIKNIDEALLSTKWAGRIETIKASPKVIVDGAHNPAGAEALANYISGEVLKEKAVLLLGAMSDKDIHGICKPLVPLVREVICVKAPSERGASPKDIAAIARSFGATVHSEADVPKALSKWIKKIGKDDTLIVSGSLSVVGEAKKFFSKK